MRKPTPEERELGLDPNKYSQKPVNPADFVGWSKQSGMDSNAMTLALKKAVDEMQERSNLAKEQERLLGPATQPDPMEIRKQKMFQAMKSIDPTSTLRHRESAAEFFAQPAKQKLIKDLGLETDVDYGDPILDDEDHQRFEASFNQDEDKMDRRTQMLRELLTE